MSSGLKDHLRRLRRRLRELRGQDLSLPLDVRLRTLHLGTVYGGWMVAPDHLQRGSCVFSIGLGTDISFDLEMIRRFDATVHGFDPTPKSVVWLGRQALPAGFRFRPVGLAAFDGEQVFRLPRADFDSYSSDLAGGTAVDEVTCPVERLSTMAAAAGCGRIDLLKMDIEGGEYACMADVLSSGVPVGQLLVELHYDASSAQIARARQLVSDIRAAGFRLFARSPVGRELSFIHESML